MGYNLKTTELDKFNVDIYDIKTGEKLKTIDVKSIFDNDDNIKPDRPYKAMALEYDGKPYIMVWSEQTSEDIENGNEYKGNSLINSSTGKPGDSIEVVFLEAYPSINRPTSFFK